MADDLRLVDVQHRFAKSPHAALIDALAAAEALIEHAAVHTGCAPCRAIPLTRTSHCTSAIALRIASPHDFAFDVSQMAKIVGPEPLIEQPNAPASSAARLTSAKCGISAIDQFSGAFSAMTSIGSMLRESASPPNVIGAMLSR